MNVHLMFCLATCIKLNLIAILHFFFAVYGRRCSHDASCAKLSRMNAGATHISPLPVSLSLCIFGHQIYASPELFMKAKRSGIS